MTTETAQEISRQKILKGLLEAVKQCQREYGGKSELATDSNPSVVNLLVQFEATFQHGLKKGRVWGAINSLSEPLRQVTGSLLSNMPESEPTFWPIIKDHLGNLEVQRFLTLRQVSTDLGRARSFIRSCLNEHSLERHVASFLADRHSIRQYYEDWALLLDDEKASTLPVMARGLAPIFFAVQIDHPMLDEGMAQPSSYPALKTSRVKPSYDDALPIIAGEPTSLSSESVSGSKTSKKKKKRKVKTVNLNSIEGDGSFDDQSLDDVITSPFSDSFPPDQEKSTSNPIWEGPVIAPDSTSLPQDIPNISERRRSNDMSLIERVASLNTSFKRSLSITSQDPEESPSKGGFGATSDMVLERDFEPHFYENPGIPPEVTFQYEKQTAANELPFSSVYSSEEQQQQQLRIYKPLLCAKTEEGVSSSLANEKPEKPSIHVDEAAFAKLPRNAGDSSIKEDFFDFGTASRDNQIAESGLATSTNHQGARAKQSSTVSIRTNSHLQTSSKARTSSDLLHLMLGSGEQLSVPEGAFDKLVLEEGLRTPPATPEPDSVTPGEASLRGEGRMMAPHSNGLKNLGQVIREKLSERFEGETFEFDAWEDRQSSTQENGTQATWADFGKGNAIAFDLRKENEVEDTQSVTSSTTENDSLDILQPVGYDSTKFHDLVMTYDMESMKAASDTLAVLNHSNSIEPVFQVDKDMDSRISSFLQSDIKNSNLDSSASYGSSLSVADLKEAILSTTKRKDYLEDVNRTLQSALDEEKEYALMLKGEVDSAQEQLIELQEKNQQKIHDLSRENNVLRNQLKKYVAAVQLLRKDNKELSSETSDAISTLRGLKEDSDVVLPEDPRRHTSSESDSIFEEKLAQIAEMHGELLEFNEHLQRQLIHRESQVSKMREELISLRGPLPQDLETASSSSPELATPTGKPLINIWIPSVFAKGKGSEAYHVYQVYIRIGDEEWNIYRRYSQFFKIHSKSSKQFACLADFSFPPKKILGKKDLKFVEGRRRRLQEYLRKLINLMLSANEALAEQPNKQNLVQIEPFFGEPYSEEEKRSGSMKSKKKKAPNFYTGL